jgi:hypothetical protein
MAYIIIGTNGPCCPRCGRPTEIRTHRDVGTKQLRKPYYYSRWLYCTDRDCKTTTYMQEKFKVWNDNLTGTEAKASAAAPETEGDLRQIPQP